VVVDDHFPRLTRDAGDSGDAEDVIVERHGRNARVSAGAEEVHKTSHPRTYSPSESEMVETRAHEREAVSKITPISNLKTPLRVGAF
jgi:hypothetical protein